MPAEHEQAEVAFWSGVFGAEHADRLEALGATRVEKIGSWWVMRDPAGLTFCIVPSD